MYTFEENGLVVAYNNVIAETDDFAVFDPVVVNECDAVDIVYTEKNGVRASYTITRDAYVRMHEEASAEALAMITA